MIMKAKIELVHTSSSLHKKPVSACHSLKVMLSGKILACTGRSTVDWSHVLTSLYRYRAPDVISLVLSRDPAEKSIHFELSYPAKCRARGSRLLIERVA